MSLFSTLSRIPTHWKILIGMVLGVVVGLIATQTGNAQFVKHWIEPFGTIFIALLKMVAIPLIIVSLIKGVSDLRDMSKLSAIGGRTMGLYVVTTAVATILGLIVVNLFQPGSGITPETREKIMQLDPAAAAKVAQKIEGAVKTAETQKDASPLQFLVDMVPDNFMMATTQNGQMLQVIFFVVLFAIALVLSRPEENPPVLVVKNFFDGANTVVLKMIDIIMMLAPLGVFALLANLIATAPSNDIFIALGWYAFAVVFGLLLMLLFDLMLAWLFAGRSPLRFLRAVAPAQLLAFSSSSSAATMPVTMHCATKNLGMDEEVASFVIPVGATVNMDGTALYQAVATVFIAQAMGVPLDLGAQASIVLTATLASIGSAAVPGAGMLMLVVILQSVGLDPATGIVLIFAIDRPLDMCRTIINITGDLAVGSVVAKSLGKLHDTP